MASPWPSPFMAAYETRSFVTLTTLTIALESSKFLHFPLVNMIYFSTSTIDFYFSCPSSHNTQDFLIVLVVGGVQWPLILCYRLQYMASIPVEPWTTQKLLCPYNTSVFPYYYCHCSPLLLLLFPCCPHIVIIVPHRSPLLLLLFPYYCYVGFDYIVTPQTPIYRKKVQ